MYHDVTLTTKEFVRDVTAIDPKWLTDVAHHYFELKSTKEAAPAAQPGQRPGTMKSTMEEKREAKRALAASKKRRAPGAAIVFRSGKSTGAGTGSHTRRKTFL